MCQANMKATGGVAFDLSSSVLDYKVLWGSRSYVIPGGDCQGCSSFKCDCRTILVAVDVHECWMVFGWVHSTILLGDLEKQSGINSSLQHNTIIFLILCTLFINKTSHLAHS